MDQLLNMVLMGTGEWEWSKRKANWATNINQLITIVANKYKQKLRQVGANQIS